MAGRSIRCSAYAVSRSEGYNSTLWSQILREMRLETSHMQGSQMQVLLCSALCGTVTISLLLYGLAFNDLRGKRTHSHFLADPSGHTRSSATVGDVGAVDGCKAMHRSWSFPRKYPQNRSRPRCFEISPISGVCPPELP